MGQQLTLEQLQREATDFRRACQAVMLSTVSPEGAPDASYAPCTLDNAGRCYILISQLAQHTKNLLSTPHASLLWIDATSPSRNVFAQRRLQLQCKAENIPRDSDTWQHMLGQMEQQHGNTVALLTKLSDFMLFRFDAIGGNYIRGFAQAHPVTGNALAMSEPRRR